MESSNVNIIFYFIFFKLQEFLCQFVFVSNLIRYANIRHYCSFNFPSHFLSCNSFYLESSFISISFTVKDKLLLWKWILLNYFIAFCNVDRHFTEGKGQLLALKMKCLLPKNDQVWSTNTPTKKQQIITNVADTNKQKLFTTLMGIAYEPALKPDLPLTAFNFAIKALRRLLKS